MIWSHFYTQSLRYSNLNKCLEVLAVIYKQIIAQSKKEAELSAEKEQVKEEDDFYLEEKYERRIHSIKLSSKPVAEPQVGFKLNLQNMEL